MELNLLFTVVVRGAMSATGLFFLAVGLRGLVTRKPFVISSMWGLVPLLAGLPLWLENWAKYGRDCEFEMIRVVYALILLTIVLVILGACIGIVVSREYVAFAVTDASLREGLLASLKKVHLPHEETAEGIRLPTLEADLQVTAGSKWGCAKLHMKQRQLGSALGVIVHGMNEYYSNSKALAVGLRGCKFYVFIGVSMLLVGLIPLWSFIWHP